MDNFDTSFFAELEFREIEIKSASHILVIEINDFLPGTIHGRARSRVIPNILHLLDHIDKHRIGGNFYITPELMIDFPEIISLVFSRGHEIGLCLDYRKTNCSSKLSELNGELELITGRKPLGVLFKGTAKNGKFHLQKLACSGYKYCVTDFDFGAEMKPGQPLNITFDGHNNLQVLRPSNYSTWGIRLKFGQEGSIRLLPMWFLRRCFMEYSRRNQPALVNFPLWEFDPHLPRRIFNPIRSFKSYGNLSIAGQKLTRLLKEFDFETIPRVLGLGED